MSVQIAFQHDVHLAFTQACSVQNSGWTQGSTLWGHSEQAEASESLLLMEPADKKPLQHGHTLVRMVLCIFRDDGSLCSCIRHSAKPA